MPAKPRRVISLRVARELHSLLVRSANGFEGRERVRWVGDDSQAQRAN